MSNEVLVRLRNDFREAFQDYLYQGDRMAKLLRAPNDPDTPDRHLAISYQQTALTAALQRYESARQKYVEAVMGQLAGLSAMGLRIQ
jgi:hypothetical protein